MANHNFTPFPILTTERLVLRRLSIDDQEPIFALRSDPKINQYLGRKPSQTIEDALHFINQVNDNLQKNNSVYWAIALRENKTFVGTLCLFDFSDETNSCEIGYELLTTFQGQGIMKEATELVIDFAFRTLLFQKIIAFTHNSNQSSISLLTKFNFLPSLETDPENPDFTVFTLTTEKQLT